MAMSGSLARFNRDAAALIARTPEPPRPVNPLLVMLLFRVEFLIVVTFVPLYVASLVILQVFRPAMLIIPAMLAVYSLAVTTWRCGRVWWALRQGIAARAQVLTIAPVRKDQVGGHYRVDGPTQSFESGFVASPRLGLTAGSWVVALVDRRETQVLLQLGIADSPGSSKPRSMVTVQPDATAQVRQGLKHYFALAGGVAGLVAGGFLLGDYLRSVPATSLYRAAPPCAGSQQPTRSTACYARHHALVTDHQLVLNGRGGQRQRVTFAIEGGRAIQANVAFSSKTAIGAAVTVKVWHDQIMEVASGSWTQPTDDNPQRHTDNIGPAVIIVGGLSLMAIFYFLFGPRLAAWPRDPLAALAVDLLPLQPRPPRMVDDGALFGAAFKATWPLAGPLTGLVVIFTVLILAVLTDSAWQPGSYLMIATLLIVPPVMLLGMSALRMPRYRRTMRLGVPGTALVETRQSSTLGAAKGTYRVHVPGRTPFVDRYFIELPAALKVAVGTQLVVLADPDRPKTPLNVRVLAAKEAAA